MWIDWFCLLGLDIYPVCFVHRSSAFGFGVHSQRILLFEIDLKNCVTLRLCFLFNAYIDISIVPQNFIYKLYLTLSLCVCLSVSMASMLHSTLFLVRFFVKIHLTEQQQKQQTNSEWKCVRISVPVVNFELHCGVVVFSGIQFDWRFSTYPETQTISQANLQNQTQILGQRWTGII